MDFENKVAIVTGAGGKLGQAIALGLAAGGATLLVSDLRDDLLGETVAAIRGAGGTVEPFVGDISRRETCVALVEAAVSTFGRLDIVVNNAAVIFVAPLDTVQPDLWEKTFAVNLHAPFYIMQAAMPHLLESHGNIVNICSNTAFQGQAYMPSYGPSKAALLNLTLSLAVEFINAPVRINAVAPGAINTSMAHNTSFPAGTDRIDFELIKRTTPIRPYSEPGQIAEVVLFLASEKASAVHGACFTVDQGMTAG